MDLETTAGVHFATDIQQKETFHILSLHLGIVELFYLLFSQVKHKVY